MMVAMMTVCDPGDKVGLFSPFYENYSADAILSGATPVLVPLHPPHYRFDPAELRARVRERAEGVRALQSRRIRAAACSRAPSCCRSPRSRRSSTCSCSPTRSTSTSSSAAPAHLLRRAARHGEAHADVLVALEDVFDHRLALGYVHARRRSSPRRARSTISSRSAPPRRCSTPW
jgi:hypothetical protein